MEDSIRDFREIDAALRQYCKPFYDQLQKPLEDEKIKSVFIQIGIKNEELQTLYRWKNGIQYNDKKFVGEYDLCSYGKMIPLVDAAELYKHNAGKLWDKRFFPIFTTYGGDYLLYDTDENSATHKMILLYSPGILITQPTTIYDGLNSFIFTISSCFRLGVYTPNMDDSTLEIDFDQEQATAKDLNPKSQYWNM